MHKHKKQSSHCGPWQHCVLSSRHASAGRCGIAHGGVTIIETCSCGLTRLVESNGGRRFAQSWEHAEELEGPVYAARRRAMATVERAMKSFRRWDWTQWFSDSLHHAGIQPPEEWENLSKWRKDISDRWGAEIAEKATQFRVELRKDAMATRSEGKLIMTALRNGNFGEALERAERCERIERRYGDSPAWRQALVSCRLLVDAKGQQER